MKRILAAVLAAGVLAGVPVATAAASRPSAPASKNIVALAASNPQLSTLVSLVKSAGLVKALSGSAKLTVFAPDNAAFAKVPKKTLTALAHNKKMLASVLEYHVVKGAHSAAQLQHTKSLKTLEGSTLKVSVKGGSVYVNQAKVVKADVQASNGVVHVINGVLMPPSSSMGR